MTIPRRLRASSLPLNMACGGSAHPEPGEPLIDPVNEAAEMGSAVHELVTDAAANGSQMLAPITPVAQRYGVDADELGMLAGRAHKLMGRAVEWFDADSEIEAEVEMRAGPLTGHADLLGWHDERTLLAIDLKTGRLDSDHYDQMAGYAWLGWKRAIGQGHEPERVLVAVLWARDAEVEVYEFSVEQLYWWRERVDSEVLNWDGTYRPGPQCHRCPRYNTCPAIRAMVRREVDSLAKLDNEDAIDQMVGALLDHAEAEPSAVDRLAETLDHAKAVAELAERLRKSARDQLSARGGVLSGEQKTLRVETQHRRYLRTRNAWSVLSQHVEPERLLDACTIKRQGAMDLIREQHPKGQKKAAAEAVEAELDEAGAVDVKEIKKLSVKRSDKAIAERSEA